MADEKVVIDCTTGEAERVELTPEEQAQHDQDMAAAEDAQQGELRAERDRRLAASDWTQAPDATADTEAWAAYRQELRDLPESVDWSDPQWPDPPA